MSTFHVVCENRMDTQPSRWVIISLFHVRNITLISSAFLFGPVSLPQPNWRLISLAALHIPLIFYCNRSYLCAGLTRAPACQPALLVVQNVVYMKQLTQNPKGLLQVLAGPTSSHNKMTVTIKSCIRAALLLLFCLFFLFSAVHNLGFISAQYCVRCLFSTSHGGIVWD